MPRMFSSALTPSRPAHDDDLVYYLGDHASQSTLADELKHVLVKYRPAIAGFPWKVGDERFEGMRALRTAYLDAEVAPLTGFDNGMVVYHQDLLPLFFVSWCALSLGLLLTSVPYSRSQPFAPQGEGGFTGKWTLGAHFLQVCDSLTLGYLPR